MALIGAVGAQNLRQVLGPGVECSGGSAANIATGAAMLGARTAFVGRVRGDGLGMVLTHDIRAAGVRCDTPAAVDGPDTAVCLVMVTPDAHRTMCTLLGASIELRHDDIGALVSDSAVLYRGVPPGIRPAHEGRCANASAQRGTKVAPWHCHYLTHSASLVTGMTFLNW